MRNQHLLVAVIVTFCVIGCMVVYTHRERIDNWRPSWSVASRVVKLVVGR